MLNEVVQEVSVVAANLAIGDLGIAPDAVAYRPRHARKVGDVNKFSRTLPVVVVVDGVEESEIFAIGYFKPLEGCFFIAQLSVENGRRLDDRVILIMLEAVIDRRCHRSIAPRLYTVEAQIK